MSDTAARQKRHKAILDAHYGDGRPRGDVIADRFVAVFGSWSYILWQTAVIIAWMTGNTLILRTWIGVHRVPDPYPFILLNLMFSAQASYAAPLILMAQNRGARRDKDFASHQFEIIDGTHAMLKANTDLTRAVKRNTDMLEEIHEHVSALAPLAGQFPAADERLEPAQPGNVPTARARRAPRKQ